MTDSATIRRGRVETRAVLAGSYVHLRPGHFLSHAVELDERGNVGRVLCGRVNPESIADPFADDVNEPPTCQRCAERLRRTAGGAK